MERLGETVEFGEELLKPLRARGWQIHRRRGFAGDGVLLIARLGELEQRASGPTLAAAANELLQEIGTYWRSATRAPEQLRLFEPAAA